MKKTLIFTGILSITIMLMSSCTTCKLRSGGGSAEKKLVQEFMDLMVADTHTDFNEKTRPMISPKYLEENNLEIDDYSINLYYPTGYEIKEYDKKEKIVTVLIWGESRDWVHRLYFKTVKENGKIYFYPEQVSGSYIYPWYKVDSYIGDE